MSTVYTLALLAFFLRNIIIATFHVGPCIELPPNTFPAASIKFADSRDTNTNIPKDTFRRSYAIMPSTPKNGAGE